MKCMVTGVSRGIGRALAVELAQQGHAVWGISRTPALGISGDFHHSICDVADDESRRRAGAEMDAADFVPDAVILNAAIEYQELRDRLAWTPMQSVFHTNVEGALYWVSRWMDRNPRPSVQFVALSSLFAQWPDPDCPAYATSKAALSMAFRSLRLRHVGEPVAFKRLVLGPVHTSINPRFRAEDPAPRGVVLPEAVARYLANTVLPSHRVIFYYPWTVGLVGRFGAWMSDLLFEHLTRPLRR